MEGVEKDAGALGVNLVGAKALEDLAEDMLQLTAVLRRGDDEAPVASSTGAGGGGGFGARGMVVVAEALAAKGG